MELHPDLEALDARYRELHDRVVSGELSFDDALVTLRHLVCLDGAGAQWGIDESGNFYRIRPGDVVAEVCDPALFSSPTATRPARAPWEQPEALMGPPGASAGRGEPSTPRQTRRKRRPAAAGAHAAKRRRSRRPITWRSVLHAATTGRGRTVTALVAATVCLVYLAVFVRDDRPASRTATTTTVADPSTSGAPQAPSSTEASPPPSAERVTEVVSGVLGGNREIAAGLVQQPGDPSEVVLAVASLDGLDANGLSVRTGPVEPDGAGRAVQAWSVVDTGGVTRATATVRWVAAGDGVWLLESWPEFAAGP